MSKINIFIDGKFEIGNQLPLTLIAGPCVMESRQHALDMAGSLQEICNSLHLNFIYKTSFDKANRTSLDSPRGLGLDSSLAIFDEIKETIGCPLLTDVHSPSDCDAVSNVIDILQIPAFLCRQTDLIVAAAKTNLIVNIKKGQFLAPWDMKNVVSKMLNSGNNKILLTERGASFGYNNLISDMRSIPILKSLGFPVVFDATHSVQQPGGKGHVSGGQREYISVLSRAAVSVGVAAIFLETHQDPDNAPSDGPNMLPLKEMKSLLELLIQFDKLAKHQS